MKVLMTTDAVGGVWGYSLGLAKTLRAHGMDVVLALMGPPPSDAQRRDAAAVPLAGFEESAFELEWMDDPWDEVEAAGEWLLALAHEHAVDLVHLNGFAHGALPWERPVLSAGHSCVFSWWRAVHGEPPPPHWRRYLEAARAGLAASDAVVAPTRAMLDELVRHYGARDGAVIHNGSDAPLGGNGSREPFVLAAGRFWDDAKNLAGLDAAAAGLGWPVVAAGVGPPGTALRSIGHLPGEQLRDLMQRASVFAAPARYEPFGLAALEAARGGCALVLGDIASLREVWGDAALYADPDDSGAVRSAIALLVEDAGLRSEMSRRAQTRARRYTLARMGGQYASLYMRTSARRTAAA